MHPHRASTVSVNKDALHRPWRLATACHGAWAGQSAWKLGLLQAFCARPSQPPVLHEPLLLCLHPYALCRSQAAALLRTATFPCPSILVALQAPTARM